MRFQNKRIKECDFESYINMGNYQISMNQNMILISRKEYESMKETIEILQNPEMIKQILASEKNISEGKIKKLDI